MHCRSSTTAGRLEVLTPLAQNAPSAQRFAPGLLLLGLLFAAGIGTTSWLYFNRQQAETLRLSEESLSTIADLKVAQISNWMNERRNDAQMALYQPQVRQFLATPDNADAREDVLHWMTSVLRVSDLSAMMLLDSQGSVRLRVPEGASSPDTVCVEQVQRALRTGDIVFVDLHGDQPQQSIHFSFLVPIRLEPRMGQAADGMVLISHGVLRQARQDDLKPRLQHHPSV